MVNGLNPGVSFVYLLLLLTEIFDYLGSSSDHDDIYASGRGFVWSV